MSIECLPQLFTGSCLGCFHRALAFDRTVPIGEKSGEYDDGRMSAAPHSAAALPAWLERRAARLSSTATSPALSASKKLQPMH
jgi:hypothetical protein